MTASSDLPGEIAARQALVRTYLANLNDQITVDHAGIDASLNEYLLVEGKSLRLAMAFFACGAFSEDGTDTAAIPLGAAIEVFHAFTLIHDDIMDQDTSRRGKPTVYYQHAEKAQQSGMSAKDALHYGEAMGILAGDILQGWSASLLVDLTKASGVPDGVALAVINELFQRVNVILIRGQFLDIAYSKMDFREVTPDQTLEMMAMKTGILYEFAGRAGTAVGLGTADLHHPQVERIGRFASLCGTAFQIQDDVLGITGNAAEMGKAVGADIREGKKTLPVLKSLAEMDQADQRVMMGILGNQAASADQIREAIRLIVDHGGVEYAQSTAQAMLAESLELLDGIPNTHYQHLLGELARMMINRKR